MEQEDELKMVMKIEREQGTWKRTALREEGEY